MPVPLGRRVASAVGAGVTRHNLRGMPSDGTSQSRRKCWRSEWSWVGGQPWKALFWRSRERRRGGVWRVEISSPAGEAEPRR